MVLFQWATEELSLILATLTIWSKGRGPGNGSIEYLSHGMPPRTHLIPKDSRWSLVGIVPITSAPPPIPTSRAFLYFEKDFSIGFIRYYNVTR